MPFPEFFSRFMVQASLASVFSYLIALGLERLMPGFVAPFVNLPGAGVVVIFMLVIAGISVGRHADRPAGGRDESRPYGNIFAALLLGVCIAFGGLFLWTRVNDIGSFGLLLISTGTVLSVLAIYAFLRSDLHDTT